MSHAAEQQHVHAIERLRSADGRAQPAWNVQALRMLALQVADVWPGIERTPGVAGNSACIVRTRIPVWTLERYRQLGWTEAQLLENLPTLRAVDPVGAWAYVEAHRDEVDQDIQSNEAA